MTHLIDYDLIKNIDYKKIGFKLGLEIHQQLDTNKLFCNCPCKIVPNLEFDKEIIRRLRFSLSEKGNLDKVAIDEFKKGKYNIYKYNDQCACLVDLDEQPPLKPNKDAFSTAIRLSMMMNLNFFDKIQFMRKLIIDGSVTSGFQRTALLGTDGFLKTSLGDVRVEGINLEEDSCRNILKDKDFNVYSLDRQGIPLIEITTSPDIKNPNHALETAQIIGNLLRSFKEVKRGIGTIRQDINVSILRGARVEIKGAQNLKLIPKIVDSEIRRQLVHLSIIEELKSRGVDCDNFSDFKIYDLTSIFKNTSSKVLKENLSKKEGKVLGIRLNNFSKILGTKLNLNYRFATEISDRNKKHFPLVKGLFHSDELPNYGILESEVLKVREKLNLNENDGFILIANDLNVAKNSLKNVLEIIKELILKVPSEVREVEPKSDLTRFLRKMPGSARMYPETDILPIVLEKNFLDLEKGKIPEFYDKKILNLKKKFNLDELKVENIILNFGEEKFEELLKIGLLSEVLYSYIFDLPKEIRKREKVVPISIDFDFLKKIFVYLHNLKLNKNLVYDLFVILYKNNLSFVENFDKFLEENNLILNNISDLEIEKKIKEIILENKNAPFGALMGICMNEFGQSVDGKKVSCILRQNL